MYVGWKYDVVNSASTVSVESWAKDWERQSLSGYRLADIFLERYRAVERNASVAIDENMVGTITRQAYYNKLFDALKLLRNLDEDDPAAIDVPTFKGASSVLSLLASKAAAPPKIFSHGGDAAVFSWADGEGVKYITVSNGCAVFTRRDRGSKPVTVGVADMSESNAVDLLPFFGVISDSSSTNPVR